METLLHITVGAGINRRIDISNELRLVKAALLYADKVKLYSLTSSMLVTILPLTSLTEDQALEALEQWIPILGTIDETQITQFVHLYKHLKTKKYRSSKEIILARKTQNTLNKFRTDIGIAAMNQLEGSGIEGLISAVQTGLLDFELLNVNDGHVVQNFFDRIKSALLSGDTYPLFDDSTGSLVNAAIRDGIIEISKHTSTKSKQVGLSSGLFDRLPLFDQASVDEIVDIRKELEKPLIRFRSSIINFSRNIQSDSWCKEFDFEVEEVFREKVEPAVLEIEDAYKSNRLIYKLVKAYAEKSLAIPITSALGLLISQATELPAIVSQSLAFASGGAIVGLDTLKDWREKNQEIQRNQLYFYYRVRKSLGN